MKRLWTLFLSLSLSSRSAVLAIALHIFLIFFFLIQHTFSSTHRIRPPLRIHTVAALPQTPSSPPSAKIGKPSAHKPKAPQPSKSQNSKKKSSSKSAPPAPRLSAPMNEQLLTDLISQLETAAAPPKEALTSPPTLTLPNHVELNASVQTASSAAPPSYREAVAALLQNSLDLPERGKVVARIAIDARGAVVQCEIMQTQSQKNSAFLKNRLRELVFPCFNEFALSEERLNFTIAFQNAETY
ncbi:MAG: hypothetical protein HY861_02430 [Chlamydiia bacterium]|nr:hypothetical protein [Chlamydiia bacterium]